jgi:hypothetical protein
VEEGHCAQYEGELNEFDPRVVPGGEVFGIDGDIARSPVVVGFECVDAAVFGDVFAKKFGYPRAATDGAVR